MPHVYSNDEFVDMRFIYGESNQNASLAYEFYRTRFPLRNHQTSRVFINLVQKCRDSLLRKEHLEDMVDTPDLSKMSDEELEFYYFQTHDTDKNNKLDGLEILQAISHILDETDVSGNTNNDSNFDYYIKLIDQVLTEDDIDNDGFLDYPEYVRSRQRSSKSIKTRKEEPPIVEIIP